MNNSTIHELRPLDPSYTLVVPVEEEIQDGIYVTGQTNLFDAVGFALFNTLDSGYIKSIKSERFSTAYGDSNTWNAASTFVTQNSSQLVTRNYLESQYLTIANGRGFGTYNFDTINALRLTTEDGNSDIWNETAMFVSNTSSVRVYEHNESVTFSVYDANYAHHFNTPTGASLSAIVPSDIPNGFNTVIMNTGFGKLYIIANNLASTGTTIEQRYSGAFIYKDNDTVYAVGNLTT